MGRERERRRREREEGKKRIQPVSPTTGEAESALMIDERDEKSVGGEGGEE